MKVGDLVKRKPLWGDWVKHNPWMIGKLDLEIGIVVNKRKLKGETYHEILWENGSLIWTLETDLRLTCK